MVSWVQGGNSTAEGPGREKGAQPMVAQEAEREKGGDREENIPFQVTLPSDPPPTKPHFPTVSHYCASVIQAHETVENILNINHSNVFILKRSLKPK